jgi:hypothetical protein
MVIVQQMPVETQTKGKGAVVSWIDLDSVLVWLHPAASRSPV